MKFDIIIEKLADMFCGNSDYMITVDMVKIMLKCSAENRWEYVIKTDMQYYKNILLATTDALEVERAARYIAIEAIVLDMIKE